MLMVLGYAALVFTVGSISFWGPDYVNQRLNMSEKEAIARNTLRPLKSICQPLFTSGQPSAFFRQQPPGQPAESKTYKSWEPGQAPECQC